jgi:hypothetical protein
MDCPYQHCPVGRQTVLHNVEEEIQLGRGMDFLWLLESDNRSITSVRKVEDDPNRGIYNREAISLLTLTKRP